MNLYSYTVISNEQISKNVYKMKFSGDIPSDVIPGQFINIKTEPLYLRRPISVFDIENGFLSIVYKVVGNGTEIMSKAKPGREFNCLSFLGNGFNTSSSGENPVLIGGGIGTPPLFYLAKKLIKEGKSVSAVLGFNNKEEIILERDFKSLGVETFVTTVDGSFGDKGYPTDILKNIDYSYFYACGPVNMLKAVYLNTATSGELSFEARMGCGFGACMGCSVMTKSGPKRICKEGPVLKKEDILWET